MKILDVPQSGSLAGITSSRNRYGQYRKTRVVPVNPNSAAQVAARNLLVEASQFWRALSEAERDQWVAFAATRTFTDSLGQSYTLTGHQCHTSAYVSATLVGAGPPSEVPAEPSFAELSLGWGTLSPAVDLLSVGIGGGTTDETYLISFTPCVSPGVAFFPRPTLIKAYTWGTPGTAACLSEYTARFGAPVEDRKIRCTVQQVVDGLRGPLHSVEGVVLAAA